MARKSWDQLSDKYRARLTRAGITRESRDQGASLAKARGHTSTAAENQRRRERRQERKIGEWSETFAEDYYLGEDFIRAELAGYPRDQVLAGIKNQRKMEALYLAGEGSKATRVWEMRDKSLPEWMNMYHALFG